MNDVKRYKANELDEEDVVLASDYDEAVKFAAEVTAYAERLQAERDALRAEVERLRNPTDEMLVAGQEVWARGRIGALEDCEEARAIYLAMIAEADA